MKTYSLLLLLLLTTLTLSAQIAVTMPGDFEKNTAIAFCWSEDTLLQAPSLEIVSTLQSHTDTTWLLYTHTMDTISIKQSLINKGLTTENIYFEQASYESPWLNEYGPLVGYAAFDNHLKRFIYDFESPFSPSYPDDSIPAQLAHTWQWPLAQVPIKISANNIVIDGTKRGFSSSQVLNDNPQLSEIEIINLLKEKFNLNDWIILDELNHSGGGTSSNLSNSMVVLDFETLLVSSYPDTLPDFEIVEQNVQTLAGLMNGFSKPYAIYRIPAAPQSNGIYAIESAEEMRSYTQVIFYNNLLLIPSFGLPTYDSIALSIYTELMTGYEIHQIESSVLASLQHGIHSLTTCLPQPHYLRIRHNKVIGPQPYQQNMQITCLSKSGELVEAMWLYYRLNTDTIYQKTPIHLICPQHIGFIEGLSPQDTVHYYLEATSTNTYTTYPLSAPNGYFTFWFDVVSENISTRTTHTAQLFPNPTQNGFSIQLPQKNQHHTIQVCNLNGQVIYQKETFDEPVISINSQLSPGMYFVRISSSSSHEIHPLIVQ